MEIKFPLAEKDPGVQIFKLNMSQQCALAAIKEKEDRSNKE